MPELPKAYTPREVEGAIYERWLAADVFAPDGAGSTADPALPPFTIIQPPPNITGSLHLGHAQRTAVEDLMIRHARMRGHPTLFLPGLDHASIAAQFVLDGILAKEGESRAEPRSRALPRADARVRRDDPRGDARPAAAGRRLVRLGPAALHDGRWVGEGRARRVQAAVRRRPRLPDRGARQLVPGLPDERERPRGDRDARDGHALVGPLPPRRPGDRRAGSRTRRSPSRRPGPRRSSATPPWPSIPTTRATRRSSAGRSRIPFVERDVPIIADDVVDPAFGTGAVKITPAHDHDDHETGLRHGLPRTDDPRRRRADHRHRHALRRAGPVRGARRRSSPTSRRAATWSATAPHEMVIGRCQRSNDVIEPRLKTQWFVRTGPLAARALEATRRGRTRILPERFEKTWEHWLTNIRDWNVSRQLWWGHRIPAWYCPDGHVTVSADAAGPDACAVCGRPAAELQPGPGHLRHLVQLRAVAVLDARLAGRHARPRDLLPDLGHGDRLRHHLLLGRPDDDARARADRDRAVPHGLPVRAGPRPVRPEDVQDEGQRRRSAGRHGRVRRRRTAVRADPRRDARQRPAVRGRPSSSTPGTSPTSSGTRPDSSRAPDRRRSPRAPSAGCHHATTSDPPSAGSCPGRPRPRPPSTRRWLATPSAR